MIDLAILIGLQASGKTSFYHTHLAASHLHISKDLMKNNRRPARRQVQLITEALVANRSVAIDNTNATVELRRDLINLGRSHGASVTGYYIGAKLEDCLERNTRRSEKNRVPEVGIFSVLKVLVRPSYHEGFDRLFFVTLGNNGAFVVEPWEEVRCLDPKDHPKGTSE
jgi:predicted kinase